MFNKIRETLQILRETGAGKKEEKRLFFVRVLSNSGVVLFSERVFVLGPISYSPKSRAIFARKAGGGILNIILNDDCVCIINENLGD